MKRLPLSAFVLLVFCASAVAQSRSSGSYRSAGVFHGSARLQCGVGLVTRRVARSARHTSQRPFVDCTVDLPRHDVQRVWVPGFYREVEVPARYGWVVDRCGHRHWRMTSPPRIERVWVPGRYQYRRVETCHPPVRQVCLH